MTSPFFFPAVLREIDTLSLDDVQYLPLSSSQRGRRALKGMCQFGSTTHFVCVMFILSATCIGSGVSSEIDYKISNSGTTETCG
jgi:hypothetical protein